MILVPLALLQAVGAVVIAEQHAPVEESRPWLNASLPTEQRLDALVDAMTPQELITQLVKYSQRIDRLGVPAFPWHMEAAHGVATGGDATVFPCSLARAASFDPALEEQVARAIGVEARAKWNSFILTHGHSPPYNAEGLSLTLYAPEINVCRDPRWGRCQESRGEDPYLTGRMTVPFVKGAQNHPASATQLLTTAMLKDFVVYNLESSQPVEGSDWQLRDKYNAVVSPADLQQSFLPAFKAGVAAGVRSMMTSYHALNGIPATAHPIIQSELRERLGWEGMIMSDGGAVAFMLNFAYLNLSLTDNITAAAAAALNSGVDINSGGFMHNTDRMMDNCSMCATNMSGYAYQHLPQALQEGLVNVTQLRIAATRTLRLRFMLGLFDQHGDGPFDKWNATSVDTAAHRELARRSASEGLVLLRNAGNLLPLSAGKLRNVAVIGPNADRADTLLSNYNGCRGTSGNFINRNDPSPACRLVTPLAGLRAKLSPHGTKLTYHEGAAFNRTGTGGIAAAVAAAAAADVAVIVVGLVPTGQNNGDFLGGRMTPKSTNGTDLNAAAGEGEAHDRVSLGLPGAQLALVRAVLAAQKKTVLVMMSGGLISEPTLMTGEGAAPVIVQSFYGGEEAGTALAAALLGDAAFTGRLPVTMVDSVKQLPPYLTQQLSAPPGRTHRYLQSPPLFPFGFGIGSRPLSYTGLKVEPELFSASSPPTHISVTVDLRDRGLPAATVSKNSTEVVQVYLRYEVPDEEREAGESSIPLQELKAFRRVSVPAGGLLVVRFEIPVVEMDLMMPEGTMGLFGGDWIVSVGGTSPRTPGRLLRGGGADACAGSPERPLTAKLHVAE